MEANQELLNCNMTQINLSPKKAAPKQASIEVDEELNENHDAEKMNQRECRRKMKREEALRG